MADQAPQQPLQLQLQQGDLSEELPQEVLCNCSTPALRLVSNIERNPGRCVLGKDAARCSRLLQAALSLCQITLLCSLARQMLETVVARHAQSPALSSTHTLTQGASRAFFKCGNSGKCRFFQVSLCPSWQHASHAGCLTCTHAQWEDQLPVQNPGPALGSLQGQRSATGNEAPWSSAHSPSHQAPPSTRSTMSCIVRAGPCTHAADAQLCRVTLWSTSLMVLLDQ